MGFFFVLVLLVLAAVVGFVVYQKKQAAIKPVPAAGVDSSPARLYAKLPLTKREQPLYFQLTRVLGDEYIVLAQVAFSQFLGAKGGTTQQNNQLRARVRQKVADFMVCRRDFSIVAVIELDDSTHDTKQEKDAERDRYLRQAGIKVIRWRQIPSAEDILKEIPLPKPAAASEAATPAAVATPSQAQDLQEASSP